VSPAVLIPRPETEFVVLAVLDAIKGLDRPEGLQIADVGTGSGAIAVSVARHAPHCRITAIDISAAALDVARQNIARHGVGDRVELVEGDLLGSLPPERRFQIIASNPPYVAEGELGLLAAETRDYEPRQALVAGKTGLEVIARLLDQAQLRLVPDGWVILEISPMLEGPTRELLAQAGFADIQVAKDLAGLPRVVTSRLPNP
jgi:release factor glutamine methyltransferase